MNIVPEKTCKVCGETKPLTEFYLRSGLDGNQLSDYYTKCKTCHIARGKGTRKSKEIAGERGEQLVIDKLRSIGIYAAPGKSSEWKRQDVVAWGCVRLEVKHSQLSDIKGHNFNFTPHQQKHGLESDIVILVCENNYEITFHLFRVDHPVFYRTPRKWGLRKSEHTLKTGVHYTPHANRRMSTYGESLSPTTMREHQNRWGLIEEVRQEIIAKLLNGESI